ASGSAVTNANYFLLTDTAVGQVQTPATTSGSVLRPRAVAVVGGTLYVAESDSNRVHMLDAASFAPAGELGQRTDPSGSSNANGISGASLATPLGLASDGTTLWVADSGNHRVLGYGVATAPSTGAAATVALGQPGLLTNGFNQASSAGNGVTSQPRGVALANGKLYVADTNNNRVLVMATPVAPGQPPARVYGQPNATLSLPNSGGVPSASTLAGPRGVFADSAHVIVADTANNRVLVYDAAAAGGAAILVLGQGGFTTSGANTGGPSASTMQAPAAAYSDGTSLWVGDTGNHRVLVWSAFPTTNGQVADLVIGQASFSSVLPNQGAAGASASSLSFPSGILAANGVLYIADTGNNRVVSFSKAPAASGAAADGVLGQADLAGRGAAVVADDLTHLAGPVALAQDGENLYVVDRDLGRVLEYSLGTIMSSSPAVLSIGTLGGLTLAGPQGIAAERTPLFTSRLYIGDTGDNQVVMVEAVNRLAFQ
ncbi:MAG TPA: NHL repeat-containing protein, partial [Polyangiaceae bacterium]|nr:NHL repeat-containing protein [Polyangiaceae bacterium]